jgi:hypothetical protein
MTDEQDCTEWLEDNGQCDLEAGHFPEMRHLLINIDHGIYWKVVWPIDDSDPDVKRYLAVAQAYEDEDNRQLAEQAAARAGNADGGQ